MASVMMDQDVSAKLAQATRVTEIKDAKGNVIGYYAPVKDAEQWPALRAAAHVDFAELERRKATPQKKYSTSRMLQFLQDLEQHGVEEAKRRLLAEAP